MVFMGGLSLGAILLKNEKDPQQRKYITVIWIVSLMHEKAYDSALNAFGKIQSRGDIFLDFLEATARYHIKNKYTPIWGQEMGIPPDLIRGYHHFSR